MMFSLSKVRPIDTEEIGFSRFINYVSTDDVKEVTFHNNNDISGVYTRPHGRVEFFTTVGDTTNPEVFRILLAHHIVPNYEYTKNSGLFSFLLSLIPLGLLFLFLMYTMNRMAGPQNKLNTLGKSKVQLAKFEGKISFQDVAGCEDAKEDMKEIIDYLKDPAKYVKMGARIPKGVLLEGPVGVGKTLLCKAVAGEANVPFFSTSGSDFIEIFVGVGASRVRDLFATGRKNAPCIIFIDEIDAVGRKRGNAIYGGHDEREQTLNQLLTEMDGFNTSTGVIIMGATNRADVLDPALVRPGRFDRHITFSNPDMRSRRAILDVHVKGKPVDSTVDLDVVAKGTPGFSGADLENLVNEATLLAVRANQSTVTNVEFENARDKILMGSERKTLKFTEEDRKTCSFHEVGHCLVNKLLKGLDAIHKVTIIPRGKALGVTQTLAIDDKVSMSKDILEKTLSFLMGGRAAEELVFGQFTSGASNDIARATELATKAVCEWGMSDLGPIAYTRRSKQVQAQVKNLIDTNYKRAYDLLSSNRALLDKLAEELLSKETLTGDQVDKLILNNN